MVASLEGQAERPRSIINPLLQPPIRRARQLPLRRASINPRAALRPTAFHRKRVLPRDDTRSRCRRPRGVRMAMARQKRSRRHFTRTGNSSPRPRGYPRAAAALLQRHGSALDGPSCAKFAKPHIGANYAAATAPRSHGLVVAPNRGRTATRKRPCVLFHFNHAQPNRAPCEVDREDYRTSCGLEA